MPVKKLVALVVLSLFAACNVGPQPFPPGVTGATGNEDTGEFAGAGAVPRRDLDPSPGLDASPPSAFSDASAVGGPDGGTADAGSDGGDGGDGGRADGAF